LDSFGLFLGELVDEALDVVLFADVAWETTIISV
jgi:hypothetical protein